MTRLPQLAIARYLLGTGIVKKVYHSCQLVFDEEGVKLFPAYKVGEEYMYAGINDTAPFAYIRTNGDYAASPFKLASCEAAWELAIPLRVVVFSDNEAQDFGYLLTKLATFTMQRGVFLQRIIDDKWRLLREESEITRQRFTGKTFYVAFDVLVKPVISYQTCEEEKCPADPNPICL